MNLTELLDESVRRHPQKIAFVEDANTITYAALAEKIADFAGSLKALGLPAGARVGLCFPNGVDYIALTYALWRIEAVVVPVGTECPPEELTEIATAMELSAILSQKPVTGSE